VSDLPIQVYVRDSNRQTFAELTTWTEVTCIGRFNDLGQWTLVTENAADAAALTPPTNSSGQITARRGLIFRREDANGVPQTFMSGWTREPDVESSEGQTVWTFTGYNDTVLLRNALCWPLPTQPANQQTESHDIRTGTVTSRIKGYFDANVVNRQAVAGAVAQSVALGAVGVTKARFKGLLELAQELCGRAINFEVRQRDSDRALYLQFWTPEDKRLSVQFSPSLGTVQSWSRSSSETTCNRVIIGAGGEMELRVFRQFQDAESIGDWGPIEQFKDRRDISPEDPALEDELTVDGLTFLDENKGRSTFKIDINGSPNAQPWVHYRPGDLVRAYIDTDENAQPVGLVDDLVWQVEATWSADGESGAVQIGNPEDTPDEKAARLHRKTIRRVTDLETRR
jgi:hypothetical protein